MTPFNNIASIPDSQKVLQGKRHQTQPFLTLDPHQMFQSLAGNETQVELSEKSKAKMCLVHGYFLSGETLQPEVEGERGQAWPAGRQV